MPLLSLSDDLFSGIFARCNYDEYCFVAASCTRLRTTVEFSSKLELHSQKHGWTYVPIEKQFGHWLHSSRMSNFTWRTRCAMGFHEAYGAAYKLKLLGAGLTFFGQTCKRDGSAAQATQDMVDFLNDSSDCEEESGSDDTPSGSTKTPMRIRNRGKGPERLASSSNSTNNRRQLTFKSFVFLNDNDIRSRIHNSNQKTRQ